MGTQNLEEFKKEYFPEKCIWCEKPNKEEKKCCSIHNNCFKEYLEEMVKTKGRRYVFLNKPDCIC